MTLASPLLLILGISYSPKSELLESKTGPTGLSLIQRQPLDQTSRHLSSILTSFVYIYFRIQWMENMLAHLSASGSYISLKTQWDIRCDR
ncbi:unnamed protein product [Zymoseptoria tritici ST99CH_3D7]|uniref:Uncharacterized protein n=1 Tax=Zymoseptoria tritici (strain ST99CH_3D7) TaxID=1276538 RepID=A0A1X7RK84_ZYMT9|nr:unnamed protein product [Zymoseptoria tritici ST99CH_3D7]